MKGLILGAKAFIKKKLGLCSTKGCHEKAIGEITIDCINIKRCLCKKHLEGYKEFMESVDKQYKLYKEQIGNEYIVELDYGSKEADKTSTIKVERNIKVKNEEEKQLERLYNLLMRVKKSRVKKKVRKRIIKAKRRVENNKNKS